MTPALLLHFLEDVDLFGTGAVINNAAKISTAIKYADLEEAKGWELLNEATANPADWDAFITTVKKIAKELTGTAALTFNTLSKNIGPNQ